MTRVPDPARTDPSPPRIGALPARRRSLSRLAALRARPWHGWALVTVLVACLAPSAHAESYSSSRAPAAEPSAADATPDGSLTLRTFYRSEDLRWSINGGPIDIRSQLTWDDVQSGGLELDARLNLPRSFELRAQVAYGRIFDGKVQDSDYDGSHKTLEFSRSISDTDRGSLWDGSLAIGWKRPIGRRWVLTPLLGVSYHRQAYNIRNGVQIIPALGPAPLARLDSDYEGEWYGFFYGGEIRHVFSEACELELAFVSHATAYRADGFFNLRTDLGDPSFSHRTVAEGSTLRATFRFALDRGWTFEIDARHRDWESDSGRTKFRFAGGGGTNQRFNDVDLRSTRVSLGWIYTF